LGGRRHGEPVDPYRQEGSSTTGRSLARAGGGGHLLRLLWRPPLQPGKWRTLRLLAANDRGQLAEVLASMPLRAWRTDEVSPYSNDPAIAAVIAPCE